MQRHCIEKYERSIFDQLNSAAGTDYKLFWKLLRRKLGSSFEVCNTLLVNGRSYYSSDVPTGFHRHFLSVFGMHSPDDKIAPEYENELARYLCAPSSIHNQSLTVPFDWDELDKVIRSLPR